jgi:hypothetical protein
MTLKKIGLAILVIVGILACLLLWLLWYYRPTIEFAY